MNIIFLTNTYFQLITAIKLRTSKFNNCNADIIISDNSNNYEKIADNLKKAKVFNNVFTCKSKKINLPKTKIEHLESINSLIFKTHKLGKEIIGPNKRYDAFFFHNIDIFTYCIYDYLLSKNNKLDLYRFEEGYSIYLRFNNRIKSENASEKISRLLHRPSLVKNIKKIYLYHPELLTYKPTIEIEKIDCINKHDSEIKEIINKVFGYQDNFNIEENVIIFEESFYASGRNIKDDELFDYIAKQFKPLSTAIKLHPRNPVNRFKSNTNLKVLKSSNIPWEVLQLNMDLKNKILITISSGSCLASMLYFNEEIPTIFLYKLFEDGIIDKKYDEYLNNLLSKTNNKKILIPKNIDELNSIIINIKNNYAK